MRLFTSNSKFRWIFLFVVMALIAFELLLSKIAPFLDSTSIVYKIKLQWINSNSINPDILIIGDSEAYAGISPKILQNDLPNKPYCLNMALAGMPPWGNWLLFKKWSKVHKPPKILIISFSPLILKHGYDEFVLYNFLNVNELLNQNGLTLQERINSIVAQFWPSWHYKSVIKSAFSPEQGVVQTLHQINMLLSGHEIKFAQTVVDQQGWSCVDKVFPPHAIEDAEKEAPGSSTYRYANVSFSMENAEVKMNQMYLDSIVNYAISLGCHVIIAPMPIPYYADTLRNKNGTNQQFVKFIERIKVNHPETEMLMPYIQTWPNGLFMNVNHLNARGAEKYSAELSGFIKQHYPNF